MKWFCLALGAAMPVLMVRPVLAAPADSATPPADDTKPQVVVVRSVNGDGGEAQEMTFEVKAEATGDGPVVIHGQGDGNGQFVFQRVGTAEPVMVSVAEPADPNRGWLGVQLADVSPELEAHLRTGGGKGIMVRNVVKGSPADQAGILQYDIIASVDGKSVTGDLASLSEIIGAAKPGSRLAIKVLREGTETSLNAALVSRPAGENIEWKYEHSPAAEIHEKFATRGTMLRRDKDGKIVIENLGNLKLLENLPDDIKAFIPNMDELTTKVWIDDDDRSFTTTITRDGATISVKQDDGGEIVVERTDKDGHKTEASYATADALKAADAEAYDIYENAHSGVTITGGDGATKMFRFIAPGSGMGGAATGEWREEIETAMREAREAMKGANQSLDQARKHFQFRFNKALPGHPLFSWGGEDGTNLFGAMPGGDGRSFRVNPDGQIEVTIRKGENEVTKVFKNEADLQARDAELYQAYTDTQMADEE